MELYPDRVFSKPEFTTLPPYLFSGADFALIPSHDEPFGLVAVEFGRKDALSVRVTFADSDDSSGSLSNLPQQSI
jgi:alpha-1,3-glucan synthase